MCCSCDNTYKTALQNQSSSYHIPNSQWTMTSTKSENILQSIIKGRRKWKAETFLPEKYQKNKNRFKIHSGFQHPFCSHLVLCSVNPFLDQITPIFACPTVLLFTRVFHIRHVFRNHVLSSTTHDYLSTRTQGKNQKLKGKNQKGTYLLFQIYFTGIPNILQYSHS